MEQTMQVMCPYCAVIVAEWPCDNPPTREAVELMTDLHLATYHLDVIAQMPVGERAR